jgi:glucoamylase
MLYKSVLRVLAAALALAGAQGSDDFRRQTSLNQFIKDQSIVSMKGVLANIGPDGSKAQGASAGLIVASPSRTDPDCKYRSKHIQRV